MEHFSIILSSLSALAVIMAIVFDGKFKKKGKINNSLTDNIFSLTTYGWTLIIISLLMTIGNGFTTFKNIKDNNKKYQEDKLRLSKLLENSKAVNIRLINKSVFDSLQIIELKYLTKVNGYKSDSIKVALVDNALRTLEEQRKSIEFERENIFTHLQEEVKENLFIILVNFDSLDVTEHLKKGEFTTSRLRTTYLNKYASISSNKSIVGYFTETINFIDKANYFADQLGLQQGIELNKKQFFWNSDYAYNCLYSILDRIFSLKSYKEYEAFDFSKKELTFNKNQMMEILLYLKEMRVSDQKTRFDHMERLNKQIMKRLTKDTVERH